MNLTTTCRLMHVMFGLLITLLALPTTVLANDDAIQAGTAFLVSRQAKDGSWSADQADSFKQLADTTAVFRVLPLVEGNDAAIRSADRFLRSVAQIDQDNQSTGVVITRDPETGFITGATSIAGGLSALEQLEAGGLAASNVHANLDADRLARILSALGSDSSGSQAILYSLVRLQNEDGGWGLTGTKHSNALDTAIVTDALIRAGYRDRAVLTDARDYLVQSTVTGSPTGREHEDGSWRFSNQISDSDIAHTAMVLIALKDIEFADLSTKAVRDTMDSAATFLMDHDNGLVPDTSDAGTFPTPESVDLEIENNIKSKIASSALTVAEVAIAFDALQRVRQPAEVRGLYNVLIDEQASNGSWASEDIYTTALAIRALAGYEPPISTGLPDLVVDSTGIDFTSTNTPPNTGESVTVTVDLYNVGKTDIASTTVRFFERSFNGTNVVDTPFTGVNPVTVTNLTAGAMQQVTLTISAPGTAPTHSKHLIGAIADPDGEIVEISAENNMALAILDVNGTSGSDPLASAGSDLALTSESIKVSGADLSVNPAELDAERYPTTTVRVRVDNIGGADATAGATLTLNEVRGSTTIPVGSITIPAVASGQSVDLPFVWWPRPDVGGGSPYTTLTATITNTSDYASNNSATLEVAFTDSYNPTITTWFIDSGDPNVPNDSDPNQPGDPADVGTANQQTPPAGTDAFNGIELAYFEITNLKGALVGAARVQPPAGDTIEMAVTQGPGLFFYEDKLFFDTGTYAPGNYTLEVELYDNATLQYLETLTHTFTINTTYKFGSALMITLLNDGTNPTFQTNHIYNPQDGNPPQTGDVEVHLLIPNLSNAAPSSATATLNITDPEDQDADTGAEALSSLILSPTLSVAVGNNLDHTLATVPAASFDKLGQYNFSVAIDIEGQTPTASDHGLNVLPDASIVAFKTATPSEIRPYDTSNVDVYIQLATRGQVVPPLMDVVIATDHGGWVAGENGVGVGADLGESNLHLVEWLDDSSRVALISYAEIKSTTIGSTTYDGANRDIELTLLDSGRQSVLNTLSTIDLTFTGGDDVSITSALTLALDELLEINPQTGRQKSIVLLHTAQYLETSGFDNQLPNPAVAAALTEQVNRAINDNVQVHVIAYGDFAARDELRTLVALPTGGTFRESHAGTEQEDQLRALLADISAAGSRVVVTDNVDVTNNALDEVSILPTPESVIDANTNGSQVKQITWEFPYIMLGEGASLTYRVQVIDPKPGELRPISPSGGNVTFFSPFTGNLLNPDLPSISVSVLDIGTVTIEDSNSPGSDPPYEYSPSGASPTFDVTFMTPNTFLAHASLVPPTDFQDPSQNPIGISGTLATNIDTQSIPGKLQLPWDDQSSRYTSTGTAYLTIDTGTTARWDTLTYQGSSTRSGISYNVQSGHMISERVTDVIEFDAPLACTWCDGSVNGNTLSWANEANDQLAVSGHGLSSQDNGVLVFTDVDAIISDMTSGASQDFAIELAIAPILVDYNVTSYWGYSLIMFESEVRQNGLYHPNLAKYFVNIAFEPNYYDSVSEDYIPAIVVTKSIPSGPTGEGYTYSDDWFPIPSAAGFKFGQRNHIAITVSGSTANIYINGYDQPVVVNDFPDLTSLQPDRIVLGSGSFYAGGGLTFGEDFEPLITDEIRIYAPGSALSLQDMDTNYAAFSQGIIPQLSSALDSAVAAYWGFDSGLGYQRDGMMHKHDQFVTDSYFDNGHPRPVRILTGRNQNPSFPDHGYVVTTEESINIIDRDTDELWMQLLANRYIWWNSGGLSTGHNPVGEGVPTDLAGFTSSCYMDGILYVGTNLVNEEQGMVLVNFAEDAAISMGTSDDIYTSATENTIRTRYHYLSQDSSYGDFDITNAHGPLLPENSARVNDLCVVDVPLSGGGTDRIIAVATDTGLSLIRQGAWNSPSSWAAQVFGSMVGTPPNDVFVSVGPVKRVQIVDDDVYFVVAGTNPGEDTVHVVYDAAIWTDGDPGSQVQYTGSYIKYGYGQTQTVTLPSNKINDIHVVQGGSSADVNDNIIYVATAGGLFEVNEDQLNESAVEVRAYLGTGSTTPFTDTYNDILATPNDDVISVSGTPEELWIGTHWTRGNPSAVSLIDTTTDPPTQLDHLNSGTNPALPSESITVVASGLIGTQQGALAFQRNLANPVELKVRSGFTKSDIDYPDAADEFVPLVGFQPGEAIDLNTVTNGQVAEGRYLQLEVTLNRDNDQPTISPVFEGFELTYNDKTLVIDVDVEDSNGDKVADLTTIPIFDTDLGVPLKTYTSNAYPELAFDTSLITLDPNLADAESFYARARLVDLTENSVISQDADEFKIGLDSSANDLAGTIKTDQLDYTSGDTVLISSRVENLNASLPTSDVAVTLELFDDMSPEPVAKFVPAISYVIGYMPAGGTPDTRDYTYNIQTGDKIGTYTLKQTIDWGSPAKQQVNETTFTVSPGPIVDPTHVISGDITVNSTDLKPGNSTTSLTSSVTNISNVTLDSVELEVVYLDGLNEIEVTPGIPNSGSLSTGTSYNPSDLTLDASGLTPDSYTVVLKGAYTYASTRYPSTGYYILDYDGFSYTDDRPSGPSSALHLRADLGITEGVGDIVTQWTGRNTSPHVLTAPSGKEPLLIDAAINCLPVVRFDGMDDVLRETFTASPTADDSYTIFIVAQFPDPTAVPAKAAILASSTADSTTSPTTPNSDAFQIEISSAATPTLQFASVDGSGGTRDLGFDLTPDPFFLTVVRDGDTLTTYRNGEQIQEYTDPDLAGDSDMIQGYMLGQSMTGGTRQSTVMEAEEATLSSNATAEKASAGFVGIGYVDYSADNDYIEWDIEIDAADPDLVFRYASTDGSSHNVELSINGGSATTLNFNSSTGATDWKTHTESITLSAGTHTVRLTATDGGINVDQLKVIEAASGGGVPLQIDIAEIIVYASALSDGDRQSTEETLRDRYGLYSTNDVGNPDLWLRSDMGVVVTSPATTPDTVHIWRDQSGFGNNAEQTTPASRPELAPAVFGCSPAIDFTPGWLDGMPLGPWDVLLVIDKSGSMDDPTTTGGNKKIEDAKVAALRIADQFLNQLANGSKVGLTAFGDTIDTAHRVNFTNTVGNPGTDGELAYELRPTPDTDNGAINALDNQGTDFLDALSDAVSMHQSYSSTNDEVVYFLTDGLDDVWQSSKPVYKNPGRLVALKNKITELKENNIAVYPVLLGDAFTTSDGQLAEAYLRDLADTTGGQLSTATDAAQLEKVFLDIFNKITGNFRSMAVLLVTDDVALADKEVIWAQGNADRGINVYIDTGELHVVVWNTDSTLAEDEVWGPHHFSAPVEANQSYLFELVYSEHAENTAIEALLDGEPMGSSHAGAIEIYPAMNEIKLGGTTTGTALRFHDDLAVTAQGYSFRGLVGEVMYYTQPLQDTDRLLLEDYLISKYGTPPVAVAGEDQTLEDSDDSGDETVSLDGSASVSHGEPLATYHWHENGQLIAEGVTANVNLGVGAHTIDLTVSTEDHRFSTDSLQVWVNPKAIAGAIPTPTGMLFENLELSGNTAVSRGGGLYLGSDSVLVNHCTVSGNVGGLAGQGIFIQASASPTVVNTIVWGNFGSSNYEQFYEEPGSRAYVTKSDLELQMDLATFESVANHPTGTNFEIDPSFGVDPVNPPNASNPPDLHLTGSATSLNDASDMNYEPLPVGAPEDADSVYRGTGPHRIGAYESDYTAP